MKKLSINKLIMVSVLISIISLSCKKDKEVGCEEMKHTTIYLFTKKNL